MRKNQILNLVSVSLQAQCLKYLIAVSLAALERINMIDVDIADTFPPANSQGRNADRLAGYVFVNKWIYVR